MPRRAAAAWLLPPSAFSPRMTSSMPRGAASCGRGLVEVRVTGEAVADEVPQDLVDAAAVQVDVDVGAVDQVGEEPGGQPLGGTAGRVAGEDAVEVHAVDRGDTEPALVDGGRVGDGADDAPARAPREGPGRSASRTAASMARELAAVHARGDDDPGAGAGAVDQGQRNVDGERAEVGPDGAAGLGAGLGARGSRRRGGLSFMVIASVRPMVEMKSMGWGEVPSSARSAAMSPKAGESLKPWPEKPASRITFSAPGSGPTRGRLLSV